MNKKLGIGIVVIAIVAVAIFSGCIEEEEAPEATPTPVPIPTSTPLPPLNYDSCEVEEISVDVDVSPGLTLFGVTHYTPTVSLSFYDKYDRKITKFNNGETNVIVALENYGKDPILTDSTVVATGEEIPKSFESFVFKVAGIVIGPEIELIIDAEIIEDCHYIGVVVLLPDGRIANAAIDFDYLKQINTKQYVEGYADGEADARMGYSIQVSSSADKNYRDGYYDGYGGFTPVATSRIIGGYETIRLSPPISEQTRSWHPVNTFSGKEDKNTNSFTLQGEVWRVAYTVNDADSKHGVFYMSVYPKGETVGYVAHVSCRDTPCSNTLYIFEGSGDYYFRVLAANLDSWKLEVEDYY